MHDDEDEAAGVGVLVALRPRAALHLADCASLAASPSAQRLRPRLPALPAPPSRGAQAAHAYLNRKKKKQRAAEARAAAPAAADEQRQVRQLGMRASRVRARATTQPGAAPQTLAGAARTRPRCATPLNPCAPPPPPSLLRRRRSGPGTGKTPTWCGWSSRRRTTRAGWPSSSPRCCSGRWRPCSQASPRRCARPLCACLLQSGTRRAGWVDKRWLAGGAPAAARLCPRAVPARCAVPPKGSRPPPPDCSPLTPTRYPRRRWRTTCQTRRRSCAPPRQLPLLPLTTTSSNTSSSGRCAG